MNAKLFLACTMALLLGPEFGFGSQKEKRNMAITRGPLLSMDASGKIGDVMVFSKWKGRNYARKYVIPENPESTTQVNVRAAMALLVAEWQGESAPDKLIWDTFAAQFNMSGFNQYVKRGMIAYMAQLGSSTTPASVGWAGNPPSDVFTWA